MTALERHQPQVSAQLTLHHDYSREQMDLIKATMAPETSDLEFKLFLEVSRTLGLSPLQRQIHAVMRSERVNENGQWRSVKKMVIQTGIDGYRLIAARTNAHVGTSDAEFGPPNAEGYPSWAKVTARRLVQGLIAEYPATAHWTEYVQKNGKGEVNSMWKQRPYGQLAKCAEALALRKAFPAELSGVYTDTEMDQADNPPAEVHQERRQDVTAHVAQEAGVETKRLALPEPSADEQQREEALRAWAAKISTAVERLRGKDLKADADAILTRYPTWRKDVKQATAAYAELKARAERWVAEDEARREGPVEQGLAVHIARELQDRYGFKGTKEERAQRLSFVGWIVGAPGLTSTKDLNQGQAERLLQVLNGADPNELLERWHLHVAEQVDASAQTAEVARRERAHLGSAPVQDAEFTQLDREFPDDDLVPYRDEDLPF